MLTKIKNIAYLDNPIGPPPPPVDPNKNKLAPEGTSLLIRIFRLGYDSTGNGPS